MMINEENEEYDYDPYAEPSYHLQEEKVQAEEDKSNKSKDTKDPGKNA